MPKERNLGVTEASLGLTLLIGLLFVVGYVILHRLDGAEPMPSVHYRPSTTVETIDVPDIAPALSEEQPQVLTVEEIDAPAELQTSLRPDEPTADDAAPSPR